VEQQRYAQPIQQQAQQQVVQPVQAQPIAPPSLPQSKQEAPTPGKIELRRTLGFGALFLILHVPNEFFSILSMQR